MMQTDLAAGAPPDEGAIAQITPTNSPRNLGTKEFERPIGRWGIAISLFSAWLLAPYLLPHTIWSRSSPFALLYPLAQSAEKQIPALCGFAFVVGAIAILHLYRDCARSEPAKGCLLTIVWMYVALLTLTTLTAAETVANQAIGVLLPLLCGLAAARICSNGPTAALIICFIGVCQAAYTLCYVKLGFVPVGARAGVPGTGTFGDPAAAYTLALTALQIAVARLCFDENSRFAALWAVAAAVLLAALRTAGIHASYTAAVLASGYVALRSAKHHGVLLLCAISLAALAVGAIRWTSEVTGTTPLQSVRTRLNTWKHGVERTSGSFWTGVGLGAFDTSVPPARGNISQDQKPDAIPEPGNAVLHWMEEFGVVGGVFFCILVAGIFNALRVHRVLSALLLKAAWLALAVACIFDTPFGSPARQCGTALFGMLLGATLLPWPESSDTEPSLRNLPILRPNHLRKWETLAAIGMLGAAVAFLVMARNATRSIHFKNPGVPIAIQASQLLAGRTNFVGDPNSSYTLVEFGDYECPPCRAIRAVVDSLLSQNAGRLKLDFRNLPLSELHPHAMYAAIVAEAARRRGTYFDLHKLLFDMKLTDTAIDNLIRTRLQGGTLSQSMLREAREAVDADMALASRLDIRGTPTFLLCRPDGKVFLLRNPEDAALFL
jgi:hypothetical protein